MVDQISKYLVVKYFKEMKTYPVIQHVFHLTYMENTGAAYSILSNRLKLLIPFTMVALIIMVIIFLKNVGAGNGFLNTAMCFIIGGALGNLVDRVRLGYVIDYFDVRKKHFAVFNVADTFIMIGTVILCYLIVFQNLELI